MQKNRKYCPEVSEKKVKSKCEEGSKRRKTGNTAQMLVSKGRN